MSLPKSQTAVFVQEIGKPLVVGTRDVPTPKSHHILIRVQSTMRTYSPLFTPDLPANTLQSSLMTLMDATKVYFLVISFPTFSAPTSLAQLFQSAPASRISF